MFHHLSLNPSNECFTHTSIHPRPPPPPHYLYREEECEDEIKEEEEETPVTESDSDEQEGGVTVSKQNTPRYFRTWT